MSNHFPGHDAKPGHDIAERISAHLCALEQVSDLTNEVHVRGIVSAWALAAQVHYYADNPDLAPLPFAQMQLDALGVLDRLEAAAKHTKAVVRR
jgi:hypothetical protein